MSYRSDVAIAIGGEPCAVELFVKQAKELHSSDRSNLFNYFSVIYLEPGYSVYTLFRSWVQWDAEADETLIKIFKIARSVGLNYTFYRIGEDYGDVETVDVTCDKKDTRTNNLFRISQEIKSSYPQLQIED